MAVDKLVDSTQLNSDISSVATAIRNRGGTTASLTFPSGFVTAVEAIPVSSPNPILTPYTMRPDVELVQTYTYDKMLVEDEKIAIPAYTTSATTVKAAAALTPTVSLTYADYYYYVAERFLTIPVYNVTSKAKGREEYHFSSYLYEIVDVVGSSYKALVDGKIYTSRTVASAGQSLIRQLYWSSGTAVAMYTATSYGVAQVASAPSISSGVMTINAPSLAMRGSSTYFSSTYWNAMTDVRLQYVINVYRAPKATTLNLAGWGVSQQAAHIATCIDGTTNKLT